MRDPHRRIICCVILACDHTDPPAVAAARLRDSMYPEESETVRGVFYRSGDIQPRNLFPDALAGASAPAAAPAAAPP